MTTPITIFRVGLLVDGDEMLGVHPSPELAEKAAEMMRASGRPEARALAMVPVEVFSPVRAAVIACGVAMQSRIYSPTKKREQEAAQDAVVVAAVAMDAALWAAANPGAGGGVS